MPSKSAENPYAKFYLSADQADVWFIIDDERIPGHKLILSSASPWFKTMFSGSLPEQGDVDLSETATAPEFKEFLQFFYGIDVHLTLENIEGVLNLSKQSMVDDFFRKCEQFLMDHITMATVCRGYQLAILYDAQRLEHFCERAICINASDILKSESFLGAVYEIVRRIVEMPTLLCNEACVFNAIINWARVNCDNQNISSEAGNLRNQLQDLLYRIRVEAFSDQEFGAILYSNPNLFTKEEIQEMIFIRTHVKDFKPKLFTARPRLYQRDLDQCNLLTCNRFIGYGKGAEVTTELKIKRIESMIFSSNRPVLLRGILFGSRFGDIEIECIKKFNDNLVLPRLEHAQKVTYELESCDGPESKAKLHLPIVIEPNRKYELRLKLEKPSGYKRSLLKEVVEIGENIVIQFHAVDDEPDATHGVIRTMLFNSLNEWPTKLFLRERETNSNRMKRLLRQTGGIAWKCMDFVVFSMSLIM